MPKIYNYKCDRCSFGLPRGWGGCLYVENDKGERITCVHPGEGEIVGSVLGKNPSKELLRKRIGFNSDCICLDCLYQFEADLNSKGEKDKDKRECPKCKSEKVNTVSELVNKTCPKCKKGTIKKIWTGIIS